MKKLNSSQEVKKFSITLQKFLKENNIDVKHSTMLEGIAKAFDSKDWNTLNALLDKEPINYKNLSFDYPKRINIGSGGYDLAYNKENEILKISSSFFYHFENTHYFKIGPELIEKVIQLLEKFNEHQEKVEKFEIIYPSIHKEDVSIYIDKSANLVFSNNSSIITLNQLNNKVLINNLFDFFNQIVNTPNRKLKAFIYPLTDGLISSMCMRYDHSFGLWENGEDKNALIKKMNELYQLYKDGLNDKEIESLTKIGSISISQLREEVDGNGFYKPKQISSNDLIKPEQSILRKSIK